jgi:hypothetical protein
MLFTVVLFWLQTPLVSFYWQAVPVFTEKKDQEIGWEVDVLGGAGPNKTTAKSVGRLQFITSTGIGELYSLGSSKLNT